MDNKDLPLLNILGFDPGLKESKILICGVERSKSHDDIFVRPEYGIKGVLFDFPKIPYIPIEQLVFPKKKWPVINVGKIGHIQYPDIGNIFTPDLDFYRQTIRDTVNYTRNRLGSEPVVLKYATGGWLFDSVELSVCGSVVWSTPYGNTPNSDNFRLVMPSKDYLRSVLFWAANFKGKTPPPKPEAVENNEPKRYEYFYPPCTRNRGIERLRSTISGSYFKNYFCKR